MRTVSRILCDGRYRKPPTLNPDVLWTTKAAPYRLHMAVLGIQSFFEVLKEKF